MDAPAVDSLRAEFDVHYDPDLHQDAAGIASRLACARALIVRNRTRVGPALLAAGPRLVAVGRLGVGLDNIDLDACAERGVSVHPATGANVVAVAEYVIAAAAADAARGVPCHRTGCSRASGPGPPSSAARRAARPSASSASAPSAARSPDAPPRSASASPRTTRCWPAGRLRMERASGVRRFGDLRGDARHACDVLTLHVPLTGDDPAPHRRRRDRGDEARRLHRQHGARRSARRGRAGTRRSPRGRLGAAALDVFEDEPLPARSPLAGDAQPLPHPARRRVSPRRPTPGPASSSPAWIRSALASAPDS